MSADATLLVLNAGSSSIKFAVYPWDAPGGGPDRKGQAHGLGGDRPRLRMTTAGGETAEEDLAESTHRHALQRLLDWLDEHVGYGSLHAVGHRIVHGGTDFHAPVRLTDANMDALEALSGLAPLHQPHNLAPARALAELRPELPQVGCFDTAFHRTQPAVAQRFALPREWTQRGVLRYGFHGLSYEAVAARLAQDYPDLAQRRVIVGHLGNGASLCALDAGRSVATSMGFTALDGLPMGQRCGALDPGVVLYLLDQGLSRDEIEDMLYHRSGLLGMSGISHDMRQLLDSDAPAAAEAVATYVYRAAREIGSLAVALGGLDALVFTAGIGENAAAVRQGIVEQLAWLGFRLDTEANRANRRAVQAEGSPPVLVIPTDEEGMIARHTRALLS
ncbi:acetate/propionate family kinase [Aquisalimonas lutea]|uniref:acetate/propionate family kinase n=1 Tax=Aquisalimonas lutea TaxID=1327750 RepID=UPI0025B59F06|nr:acetate/propionate family kinase [Aquisalimonas lutea]MDN3516236.1 acetate/propionate family kinase [Aquisalimonas lutea]